MNNYEDQLKEQLRLIDKDNRNLQTENIYLREENQKYKNIINKIREYMSDIDYKMGWQYVEYLDKLLNEVKK